MTIPIPPGAISVTITFNVEKAPPSVTTYGFTESQATITDRSSYSVPLAVLDQYGDPVAVPDSAFVFSDDNPGIVSVNVSGGVATFTALKPGTVTVTMAKP